MALLDDIFAVIGELNESDLRSVRTLVNDLISDKNFDNLLTFRRNQIVSFLSAKHGRKIKIRISNIGTKNVIGYEIDGNGNTTSSKWTVHPSFLTKENS